MSIGITVLFYVYWHTQVDIYSYIDMYRLRTVNQSREAVFVIVTTRQLFFPFIILRLNIDHLSCNTLALHYCTHCIVCIAFWLDGPVAPTLSSTVRVLLLIPYSFPLLYGFYSWYHFEFSSLCIII